MKTNFMIAVDSNMPVARCEEIQHWLESQGVKAIIVPANQIVELRKPITIPLRKKT